ncbi:unnamed protein product [Rotaria socialis]|uniref:Uncharacterized protein n=1 Tax=Rotaria socialis TaxID=392032 RepID=A0A818Y1R8_9BILA|nr:unnamed protein product [Rotaria socialis]
MFTLGKFREEQKLPFDLLSDFNKEVSRKYDSLYEEFPLFGLKGVTKRIQCQTNKIRRNYTWERAMKIDFRHMGQPSQRSTLKNALQRIHFFDAFML